tara:strand:- start:6429 stop:7643 length:1215 start_codon:yes stop_codon:yes gene_type:complete
VKSENFILINLNQNISRARKVAQKEQRDKWIIFGLICLSFIGLTAWFFQINNNFNKLIQAREGTIENIKSTTAKLKKDAKINLSKGDIISSYDLGKRHIPWSRKLIQLSEMTPYNMCITNLVYDTKFLYISAISKIEDENQKEQQILNDFMSLIKSNEDFYKEFDKIKIKKSTKVERDSQSYLSFEISAKLKKKLKNRMDEIPVGLIDDLNNIDKEERKSKPKTESKQKKKEEEKKPKYSDDSIRLAKAINITNGNDPSGSKEVKQFQQELNIYSSDDIQYGYWDSKTILVYNDVLEIKAETSWEKEYKNINKMLAGVEEKSNKNQNSKAEKNNTRDKNGYDKLTIKIAYEIAGQIGAGAQIPDLDLIKRFQELTYIATENDSWYGIFNNETIEKLGEVMRTQE